MLRSKKFFILAGSAFIGIALIALISISYLTSQQRATPLVYSNNAMLLELWNSYKKNNLEVGSDRTIDHAQPGNVTTSEGESYTMLRAVWMDDQATFNKSWQFGQNNMQRPDHLFSWKYGLLPNGNYGIQSNVGGNNTASDGDVQIATALLMAYSRWSDPKYLAEATPLIHSIWTHEVVRANGHPLLVADNLESLSKSTIVVNPSYLNPAAFKLFAKADPHDNWTGLVDSTYSFLRLVSQSRLSGVRSDNLPPDWVLVNVKTGAFTPDTNSALDTNFSYNAIRVPFWLALDYAWFHDPRDKATLNGFNFLNSAWTSQHRLDASYAHDGSVNGAYQSPATYGATIGYFMVVHPSTARTIYSQKLLPLYNPDTQGPRKPLSYYDDNWSWFGTALMQQALPNLTDIHK